MKDIKHFDESYFHTDSWMDYTALWKERPSMFAQNEMLKICLEQNIILDYMNKTGQAIGVRYKSQYSIMVVDLVSDSDGVLFGYERILPAVVSDAVVTIPKCDDKYVLLKQYRHSLRKETIAFPRGFGEKGLSATENAIKELNEEIGATTVDAQLIGYVEPDNGLIGNRVAIVYCTVTATQTNHNYEGIKELLFADESELAAWIKAGKITDGYTLAAVALLQSQQA